MALDPPTWIDTIYVQNILRKTENDESIEISNITVKPATAKGDNYLSDLFRIGVEFSRVLGGHEIQEKGSLVVKVPLADNIEEELFSVPGAFEIEMFMMSNTLPRMNLMLTESGMPSLSARCLLIQQENPIHLLFEDLTTRGFRMAIRQACLDLDHCLLAIQNLGRFHASSIALKEKDPKALAKYTKGMFHQDNPPLLHTHFKAGVKALANETCKWHELSPRISEKLLKLSEVAYGKGCEVAKCREDEFNVLNHGDFWINNMMFNYDDLQKPIDHIFVDFQICYYASPAIDLLHFFASSASEDVRMNHREIILREYHNSLTSTMRKLKCNTEALSFDDLQETLKKHALLEVIISSVELPNLLLDKSEAMGFNERFSDLIVKGEYNNKSYRGSLYRKIMTGRLPVYDGMGLLDV